MDIAQGRVLYEARYGQVAVLRAGDRPRFVAARASDGVCPDDIAEAVHPHGHHVGVEALLGVASEGEAAVWHGHYGASLLVCCAAVGLAPNHLAVFVHPYQLYVVESVAGSLGGADDGVALRAYGLGDAETLFVHPCCSVSLAPQELALWGDLQQVGVEDVRRGRIVLQVADDQVIAVRRFNDLIAALANGLVVYLLPDLGAVHVDPNDIHIEVVVTAERFAGAHNDVAVVWRLQHRVGFIITDATEGSLPALRLRTTEPTSR